MIKIPQNMQFHCFYSVKLEKQLISHSNLLHSVSLTITYPLNNCRKGQTEANSDWIRVNITLQHHERTA